MKYLKKYNEVSELEVHRTASSLILTYKSKSVIESK